LYTQYGKVGLTPDIETLKAKASCIMQRFGRVFIVLDALDEFDKESRKELLSWIKYLTSESDNLVPGLSIFATSRREQDIERALTSVATCQIPIQSEKVDADVRLYVRNWLNSTEHSKGFPQQIKDEIETSLVLGSRGMYLITQPLKLLLGCPLISVKGSVGYIAC
jgi:hypothetical protein